MFASTLRRYASNSSLDNLEKGLLHPFTRNITCDRHILTLLGNLVNFIHIDNATLCTFDVKVSNLQEFEEYIFHILTHITSLRQSCRIRNSKRYIQALSQGLGKESFPEPVGPIIKMFDFCKSTSSDSSRVSWKLMRL